MKLLKIAVIFTAIALVLSACVTKKKYLALDEWRKHQVDSLQSIQNAQLDNIEELNSSLEATYAEYNEVKNDLLANNAQKTAIIDSLTSNIMALSSDKSALNKQLEKTIKMYESEKESYEKLNALLKEKEEKTTKLQSELEEKEKRLAELEKMIARNQQQVDNLKTIISNALNSFDNSELTVFQKDGKLYVSLDEKLLYKVGSAKVDPKGQKALKKLAEVLENNPDIAITIEGHTDDTGSAKVNWKLSTERALAIVHILQDNSNIDPARFTASGRGMYMPVDSADTKEARQKNRRTEIILTPKLDQLYKILDENK